MVTVYLGLGSNLGDRRENLRAAAEHLRQHGVVITHASSVYETAPVGYTEQPAFLNAVLQVETDLSPEALLAVTQAVESELGRTREVHWGPRTVDVDLLLYDELRREHPDPILPHPRLHERRFVLLPLVELAPDIEIPGIGPARACLQALNDPAQAARRIGAFPGE